MPGPFRENYERNIDWQIGNNIVRNENPKRGLAEKMFHVTKGPNCERKENCFSQCRPSENCTNDKRWNRIRCVQLTYVAKDSHKSPNNDERVARKRGANWQLSTKHFINIAPDTGLWNGWRIIDLYEKELFVISRLFLWAKNMKCWRKCRFGCSLIGFARIGRVTLTIHLVQHFASSTINSTPLTISRNVFGRGFHRGAHVGEAGSLAQVAWDRNVSFWSASQVSWGTACLVV
jgi:hypothetical protein